MAVVRGAWVALAAVLTALTTVLAALVPGAATAQGVAAEGVFDERTVYTNTVTEGDGTRTPDIIATSPDHAVVAWREGTVRGKVDQGYIRYAYTTDGGANWSRPRVLAQETSTHAWHYVVLYRTGDEIFAYLGRAPASSSNGLDIDAVVVKRSTDEGHTWQDHEVTLPPDIRNLIIAGRPVRLPNGTHAIPFWSSGRRDGVLLSPDLKTWTASYVPDPSAYRAAEPQVALSQNPADPPNTLIMTARTSGPGYAATAKSTDAGRTWTPFTLDPDLPNHDTKGYFTRSSDGRYLAMYNTAKDRQVLAYKVKRPGEPWSAGRVLADGPPVTDGTGAGWDTYPMADEYAPGRFFVVWEHDTSAIKVARLDL